MRPKPMQRSDAAMGEGPFFSSIAVTGLGLIGGSIVKALRLKGYAGNIIGIDPDEQTRRLAEASGLFDGISEIPAEGSGAVELLILAVPLSHIPEALKNAASLIGPDTLVTDAGSVKSTVHTMTETFFEGKQSFIGGHPMAGSDRSGFASASPILFENAYYFLTPGVHHREGHVEKLQALVRKIGAIPVITTPDAHDSLAALLSHLPHLTACALVNTFVRSIPEDSLKYAGGGFRDTTRIAMGDPRLWQDIFAQNKAQLAQGIDHLVDELLKFKNLLEAEKNEEIGYNLNRTQKIRSGLAARRPSEESSLYPLILDVEDRPGILAAVTGLLAEKHLNIKDIALDHARETFPGALILSFASGTERATAAQLVTEAKLCEVFIEQD